ncbi:ABC transporter ATP-binding protein [Microvirga aerophila]|uniref:Peptide ABC transporter ATP-binding protein n=1 Tax=Microvirga aerophila TaxID=670291 RepID=A0A512BQ10_9HYPH|nr:ABC transporter ATP-binding protein [Microvirga aerophila]GEO14035.1 peptide ABC transporter ATP-binding protein [Microvirga aerophila]
MTSSVLNIQDLVVEPMAGGRPVVDGISISVERGEVLALIGASGSGKTTLALAALGHLRPGLRVQNGSVTLDGTEMLRAAPRMLRSLRGRAIAYIAQSAAAAFNPRMRLDAQITEVSRVHRSRSHKEAIQTAHRLYGRLDLPNPDLVGSRFPHQVSGGQLQRFMIAMGLQESPLLLVCDEPTSALDVTTQVEVLRALKQGIADNNTAALFVSHDLAVVSQIATKIAVLRSGRMIEFGTARDILESPKDAYTKELVAASKHMTISPTSRGGSVAPAPGPEKAPLLAVQKVVAGFGKVTDGSPSVTTLNDISLNLRKGEIVAVIGESGSGKSTLARVIAGLHPAARGEIYMDGKRLAGSVENRTVSERRRIQLVFQSADTALNQKHSVGRILGRVLKFFHGTSGSARETRVAELLKMVQLPPEYANRLPSQLSGGEKQRVNLARALAAEPEVLICDEITSALDTIVAESIIRLVESLSKELGLGIIFISHDLATVSALAQEVTVLRHGRIVESGSTQAVLSAPQNPYTQLLVSSVPQARPGWLEEAVATRNRLRHALEADRSSQALASDGVGNALAITTGP